MSLRPIDTIWPSTSEDFEKLLSNGWPKLKAIHFEKIGNQEDKLCGIKMEFTNGLETPLIRARRHQNSQASLVRDGQYQTFTMQAKPSKTISKVGVMMVSSPYP